LSSSGILLSLGGQILNYIPSIQQPCI